MSRAEVIVPTVGRVVWYWREGTNPQDPKAQPEAATVAYVHGESMVTLSVTGHDGRQRPETSVSLRQPRDPQWTPPYAEWMPFQVGQAKQLQKDAEREARKPAELREQDDADQARATGDGMREKAGGSD